MKIKNVFTLMAGLIVAAIATINFVNANNDVANSYAIIEVQDAQAFATCYSKTDDTCTFRSSDGVWHETTNAENF